MPNAIDQSSWVRCYRRLPEAAVRLACFPHAGGSATFFFPLAEALAPHVEVLAVQYPGRQDRYREPCIDNLDDMVTPAMASLLPWTDRPLALFGHSMGATVGFEVARRLERDAGVSPLVFVASGRRPPTIADEGLVHTLDDRAILAELELGATAAEVFEDEDVLSMIMPAIRSDYKLLETYRYQAGPGLACPVVAFTGDRDAKVTLEQANGWAEVAAGDFALRVFPGEHFYLSDCVAEVAAAVLDLLGVRLSTKDCARN